MKATRKNLKKGFTLVELVIVIAVIAILAAVLIPTFSSVIKNANNSADQQLVSQLNLIGAMHQADDKNNEFEFADNIRKMLEDEGIKKDSLVTKNKDTIIVYNTQTNKFERCELDDEALVVSDSAAYYLEEIFENRIIISTGGNALAEAIYALHNIPGGDSTTDHPSVNAGDYVRDAYKKIPENLQEAVKNALEGAVIIDKGGDAVSIDFSGGEPKVVSATKGTKVIFSESVNQKFNFGAGDYMPAKVIIPNNVKSVKGTLGTVKFAGNTAAVEGIDAAHICTIAQARYSGWYLVTDASTLKAGDQIIIAYETNVLGASSSTDSTAYRQRVENGIKVTGNKAIILSDSVVIITLEAGSTAGSWALNAGGSYLRWSSGNSLPSQSSINNNSSWTIEINSETAATKIANQSDTTRLLQYYSTSNSERFAAYTSNQKLPCIYKLVGDTTDSDTGAYEGATKATVKINDYAVANEWQNETKYETVDIDSNITAIVSGGAYTGKYYTSDSTWRIYQSENATLTITATIGKIVSVKITYNYSEGGILTNKDTSETYDTNTLITVNASSVSFTVGNRGDKTIGQVKITAIEVVYGIT